MTKKLSPKRKLNVNDYSERASHWLAEGNEAAERGDKKKAERCYEKSQFWHDKATVARGDGGW